MTSPTQYAADHSAMWAPDALSLPSPLTYTYSICEVTTGRLVEAIEIDGFKGTVSLDPGAMSARAPLAHLTRDEQRDVIAITTPGKYSIVAERNGQIAGEWVIWKRRRVHGKDGQSVELVGAELLSYLDRRKMDALYFAGADQLSIARDIAARGFGGLYQPDDPRAHGLGAITITLNLAESGVFRRRTYLAGEASFGQRLGELGAVINGFDVTITQQWRDDPSGARYIARTMDFQHPRAGFDRRDYVIDLSGEGGSGGSGAALALDEDATRIASRAWAMGKGSGATKIRSIYTDLTLVHAGYPFLETGKAWSSVESQTVLDAHAHALWDISQDPELPPTVSLWANGDPALSTLRLGDRARLFADPTPTFPDGLDRWVRILGWDLNPPKSGDEIVDVQITSYDSFPGTEEDVDEEAEEPAK